MMIIINWAVYNRWFLSKGLFWKEKRKSPFSTWGFSFVWMGKGGSGTCFGFAWFLPAEVAPAAAHLRPQNRPPAPLCGPRGPTAFRTPPWRRRAVTRWHALCSQDCFLLSLLDLPLPGLPAAPAPSSAPTPVFPARILPAGWWPGRSAVGEAAPDRMAMTWDMATVTPAFSSHGPDSHRPRRVCGHCRAGIWVFFCFFSLDSCFFFKDGKLPELLCIRLELDGKTLE